MQRTRLRNRIDTVTCLQALYGYMGGQVSDADTKKIWVFDGQ